MKNFPVKCVWLAGAFAVVGVFSIPEVAAAPARTAGEVAVTNSETCAAKSARKTARKDRKAKKAAKKKRHHKKKKSAKA